jgi:hypothetical protein
MARPRDNRTLSRRWSPARRHQEFVIGQIPVQRPCTNGIGVAMSSSRGEGLQKGDEDAATPFQAGARSSMRPSPLPQERLRPVQRVWGTASV